jgi:hypothetical protein
MTSIEICKVKNGFIVQPILLANHMKNDPETVFCFSSFDAMCDWLKVNFAKDKD